jgi:hypothetical protein
MQFVHLLVTSTLGLRIETVAVHATAAQQSYCHLSTGHAIPSICSVAFTPPWCLVIEPVIEKLCSQGNARLQVLQI